jgi:ornithine cyclodeaminase/alanine dehydrogenase-like protein (mu-crystallin family)
VIGAGVNGCAAARTFVAFGRRVSIWDVDQARAAAAAEKIGCWVADSREAALASDIVVTVTPGHEVLLAPGSLGPGQHVSLMGADGPGKAEITASELARTHMFCDDWEQASHGGELAHAVDAGLVSERDVTPIGAVLTGDAPGRWNDVEITTFDSTGLALQDLAIALVALESLADARRVDL